MTDWFDPDVIRGDVELGLTNYFYPSAYSASSTYQINDRVRSGGNVFRALEVVTGTAPPSAEWTNEGPAYRVLYENVQSVFGENGAIKTVLDWNGTQKESIWGPDGVMRSIDGVLSCWIFTPRYQGTSSGLKASMRMRQFFNQWNRLGTCGRQMMITSPNGPRSIEPDEGDDFYIHILTASARAIETV